VSHYASVDVRVGVSAALYLLFNPAAGGLPPPSCIQIGSGVSGGESAIQPLAQRLSVAAVQLADAVVTRSILAQGECLP
jgi:hypothetical protein